MNEEIEISKNVWVQICPLNADGTGIVSITITTPGGAMLIIADVSKVMVNYPGSIWPNSYRLGRDALQARVLATAIRMLLGHPENGDEPFEPSETFKHLFNENGTLKEKKKP